MNVVCINYVYICMYITYCEEYKLLALHKSKHNMQIHSTMSEVHAGA